MAAGGAIPVAGAAAGARSVTWRSTSSFVRRPSLPVPPMAAGSRLFSVTSRRTAGLKLRAASSRRWRRLAQGALGCFSGGGAVGRSAVAAAGCGGRAPGSAPLVRDRSAGTGAAGRPSRRAEDTTRWRGRGLGDPRHHGSDPHRGAFPLHDLQAAGRGRGDLHRRLVRLQLEQRLVRLHGVAVALEPAGDRALARPIPERRNA